MKQMINWLDEFGILESDLDYHVLRVSMVLIFLFFGYQKWFEYEAQALIPYISNGPLISWMYPVFGVRGACWFLGVSEWSFGALIFIGFWNKTAGVLARSAELRRSWVPQRSFLLCRTAGQHLPAAFPR
jgi:uncharacterized membrane protein YkgB